MEKRIDFGYRSTGGKVVFDGIEYHIVRMFPWMDGRITYTLRDQEGKEIEMEYTPIKMDFGFEH